ELKGAPAQDLLDNIVFAVNAEPLADAVDRLLVVEPFGEAPAMSVESDAKGLAALLKFRLLVEPSRAIERVGDLVPSIIDKRHQRADVGHQPCKELHRFQHIAIGVS